MPPTPSWWTLALTQLIPPYRMLQTTTSQLCVPLATACFPPLPCSPLQVMQAELYGGLSSFLLACLSLVTPCTCLAVEGQPMPHVCRQLQ